MRRLSQEFKNYLQKRKVFSQFIKLSPINNQIPMPISEFTQAVCIQDKKQNESRVERIDLDKLKVFVSQPRRNENDDTIWAFD